MVAKIFDPLYVGLDREWDFAPTYHSERFYSCEAAAYKRIKERGLDRKFTPKFEGCWSPQLPLPDTKGRLVRREVYLILQQLIPGEIMQALTERGEVEQINPHVRMDILAWIMEGCSQPEVIGVMNDDVHPRNLVVAKDAEQKWYITLIDFSHSRVKDLPNSKWLTRVPKQYDGETKDSFGRALKWMKDRWEGSRRYELADYEWVRGPYEDDYTEDDARGEDFSDDDCSRGGTSGGESSKDGSIEEDSTTDGVSNHFSSIDDKA